MDVIYVVLPLALLIAIGAVAAYVWATRSGQFDDLDTPGWRAVMDDDESVSCRTTPHDGDVDAPVEAGQRRCPNGQ